jgi:hypothetical protein
VIRVDDYVHLITEADACRGYLEGTHAYAGRFDGQVQAWALHQEVQFHSAFGIHCLAANVDCGHGVERGAASAHGVTEEKVNFPLMLK